MELKLMDPRHTPENYAIVEYLKAMEFRRRMFGGVDLASVLDHIEQITLQYDAIISNCDGQNREQAQQIVMLEAMLAQIEQHKAAQDSYYGELIQWYTGANASLQAQNEQLYQQAAALWAEAEQSRWIYATG